MIFKWICALCDLFYLVKWIRNAVVYYSYAHTRQSMYGFVFFFVIQFLLALLLLLFLLLAYLCTVHNMYYALNEIFLAIVSKKIAIIIQILKFIFVFFVMDMCSVYSESLLLFKKKKKGSRVNTFWYYENSIICSLAKRKVERKMQAFWRKSWKKWNWGECYWENSMNVKRYFY